MEIQQAAENEITNAKYLETVLMFNKPTQVNYFY